MDDSIAKINKKIMTTPIDRDAQISLMVNSKERIEQSAMKILQSRDVQNMLCRKPKDMIASDLFEGESGFDLINKKGA